MSLKAKLLKIENELDLMDPFSEAYERLSKEADEIAEQLTAVDDAFEAKELIKIQAAQDKLDDIQSLVAQSKTDELVAKYGHEFINDYSIDGNTVHSSVAPEHTESQWTTDNPEAKLRQLIYYRIYDHYLRAKT